MNCVWMQQGPVCFGMEFGPEGFMGIYRGGGRRHEILAAPSSSSSKKLQGHMDPHLHGRQELWALRKRRGTD